MSTKQLLEIASLVCGLAGTFLLAIPMLFGVEHAVRWLLRWRERSFRVQRYLNLADKELIFGTPDSRDLKKEDEGIAWIVHPFRPHYLIGSIILFGFLVWYRGINFGSVIGWLKIAHTTIFEYLGTWGYLTYPLIGALGVLLIALAYVPFLLSAMIVLVALSAALFGAGYIVVFLVTFIFLTIPAWFFGWFVNTNQERKLGWFGFLLLFLGSIFQVFVVLFGGH
jgi:hypothetical protein